MPLPPGFRFHRTDEELINCYLKIKISSSPDPLVSIIAEIDLYKFDPWELPGMFWENEWFFYSPRDRKYPNGNRPNRSAASGYWKATGIHKPILCSYTSRCVGVKKALVFYKGRAPRGIKTKWMMYEYRLLNGHDSLRLKGSMRLDDWVLCRVRHKSNTVIEQRSGNGHRSGQSSLARHHLEGFNEIDASQHIDFLTDHNFAFVHNSRVLSGREHLNQYQEGSSSHYFVPYENQDLIINGDSHLQANAVCSMTEALDKIKRVLSLGAIDEQENVLRNKRHCSVTSLGYLDKMGVF